MDKRENSIEISKTEFQKNAELHQVMAMDPDQVAIAALNNLGKTTLCIPGATNKIGVSLTKLFPRSMIKKISGLAIRSARKI